MKIYPAVASLTLLSVAAVAITAYTARPEGDVLPVQFRLREPRLSDLPVRIDNVASCSCWRGPRQQVQRKFKFRIANHSDTLLDIGGGVRSALRLIVAYPDPTTPMLTLPATGNDDKNVRFESPPDTAVQLTSKVNTVPPSRIVGSNEFLGVPKHYTVWALPPNPNNVAEELHAESIEAGALVGTYPTVVERPRLLPDEVYSDERLGHGAWTFYIPLSRRSFASLTNPAGGGDTVYPREVYERHVIFVGIATFQVDASAAVRLSGFAPAPSDDALLDPSAM